MPSQGSLAEYRKKRDFTRTAEPRGKRRGARRKPRFVVQKHAARSLHYDFRLEVSGVLKSWAVPKGPSTDPRDKRLAMPTEDHPLEYADFEGTIPAGQYGAGSVIVWDRGTYRPLGDAPTEEQLERGSVRIDLHGDKLRGGYALQRIAQGKRARWLLVKTADEAADARRKPTKTAPASVLSGRTIEDVEREAESEQQAGKARPKARSAPAAKRQGAKARSDSHRGATTQRRRQEATRGGPGAAGRMTRTEKRSCRRRC